MMDEGKEVADVNQESIELAYDGPAVREGVMDVGDLGPALVSLGDLFERANRIVNGTSARVEVRVRADVKRGSFELAFDFVQLVPKPVTDFLVGEGVAKANEILTFLGLVGGGIGGLLGLLRVLKGRKPEVVETSKSEVTLAVDGNFIHVHQAVFQLYADAPLRRNVQGVLEPLRSEGIDELKVRRAGQTVAVVEKAELEYFAFEEVRDDPTVETESEEVLEVVKPSFRENLRWHLWTLDGTRVGVEMADEEFTKSVQDGTRAFRKGDILRVRVRTRAWKTAGEWKVERRVIKVLDHRHPELPQARLL